MGAAGRIDLVEATVTDLIEDPDDASGAIRGVWYKLKGSDQAVVRLAFLRARVHLHASVRPSSRALSCPSSCLARVRPCTPR